MTAVEMTGREGLGAEVDVQDLSGGAIRLDPRGSSAGGGHHTPAGAPGTGGSGGSEMPFAAEIRAT